MGIPGKDTKLVDDKRQEKERFRTLKNVGRKLTGRNARIDQDIDVLNGIEENLNKISLDKFFSCEANRIGNKFKTYKLCCSGIEVFLKQAKFDDLWKEAKEKHKTIRIHDSSISLWWKEVLEKAQKKDAEISNEIKGIDTDNYTKLKSKLKSLESILKEPLNFVKIGKDSKKSFSSLNSDDVNLAKSVNNFNAAVNVYNEKISESLKKAIGSMNKIVDYFVENIDSEKKQLRVEFERFEKRFSDISDDIPLVRYNPEDRITLSGIEVNIKDARSCIEEIERGSDKMSLLQDASDCIYYNLPSFFKELEKSIKKAKEEKREYNVSNCVNLAKSLCEEAELWSIRFKCSNKDLSKIRDNMKLINEKSNDTSENFKFFDDLVDEMSKRWFRFRLYCILCNKLPDYISKFDNEYLDSIVRIKDSTISVRGIANISRGWIPNFNDVVSVKLKSDNGLTRGIEDHRVRYRFYENLQESFGKILSDIRKTLKPFEKLTKSNCDEAIKAIDKFLDDNKDSNLLESRKIVAGGGMKDCFDDSGKNWSQVREQWNKFMEESSDRIKKVLESAKLEIETLKSGGKLPGLSQLPSENSVIKPNDQKPDGQKPDSKKSGQKHRFFSGFRRSKK